MGSLHAVSLHEAFLAATFELDNNALGSLVDPNCTWAERDYLSDIKGGAILELHGANATTDYLGQWHRRYNPERVSVLNRMATDWFVFAEELWIVRPDRGCRRQFRKAVIYPINAAGRMCGAIGFGTDLEPTAPLTDICVGQAFWPEDDANRYKPMQSRTLLPRPM
jgi:hypothetical protein